MSTLQTHYRISSLQDSSWVCRVLANIRERWLGLEPSMGLVVPPAVLSRRKLVPNQSSSELSAWHRHLQLQALPQEQRGLHKAGLHKRKDRNSARLDQLRESRFPRHVRHPQQRLGSCSWTGKLLPYLPWSGSCAEGSAGA
jgi:hypothetical protein